MRRIRWSFFALVIILLATPVIASEEQSLAQKWKGVNIVEHGSFNTAADVGMWGTDNNAKLSYVETGATFPGGSVAVEVTEEFGALNWACELVKGETYEISFWAKGDGKASTMTVYMIFIGGGWKGLAYDVPVSKEWRLYTYTYDFDGINNYGDQVVGNGHIAVRYNTKKYPAIFYMDELSIKPSGKIDYNYNSKTPMLNTDGWIDPLVGEKQLKINDFEDMKGHWGNTVVSILAANNIISGYETGQFCPDQSVTRAEFANMILQALKLEPAKYEGQFYDIKDEDWYAGAVSTLEKIGALTPAMTIGGKFQPDRPITRLEAAEISVSLCQALAYTQEQASAGYTDIESLSNWQKETVALAEKFGLMRGDDGEFKPKDQLKRAEAAMVVLNLAEKTSRMAIFIDQKIGSDDADGTLYAPVKSVEKAKQLVRKYNNNMQNHIFVVFCGDAYYVQDTIKFDQEDSGTNGYNVIYTSYDRDNMTSVHMGKQFGGFSLYNEEKNIYRTYVGTDVRTRQCFIDGVRAIRARSEGTAGLKNAVYQSDYGLTTTDTSIASYKNLQDVELVYYEDWTQPRITIDHTVQRDGLLEIHAKEPGWGFMVKKGQTAPSTPAYIENAYELLDNYGEWYLDNGSGWLYYKPRPYEDPETMTATLPVGEYLIEMTGGADAVVHNIEFRDLCFAYTTWMRPSGNYGHSDAQSNTIRQNGDTMSPSAIMIHNARYVDFYDCTFTKLGINALSYYHTMQECNISGNKFYDISGNGIVMGLNTGAGDTSFDYLIDINPTEYKYYCINNSIDNNYIIDVGVEYGASVGIAAAFPKCSQISHNEIAHLQYSGMHIGYGWNSYAKNGTGTYRFDIENNYVHEIEYGEIYDGGCIYTIGATGGTKQEMNNIRYNYLENQYAAPAMIYSDEGSTYWNIERNVITSHEQKNMLGNNSDLKWCSFYFDTIQNNVAHHNWTNLSSYYAVEGNEVYDNKYIEDLNTNMPAEAKAIMDIAGLTEKYLEKYPNECQTVYFEDGESISVGEGEKYQLSVAGRGRKGTAPDYDAIWFTSSNPAVATVDNEGIVRSVSSGVCTVQAYAKVNDVVKTAQIQVFSNDNIARIAFTDTLYLIDKTPVTLAPKAYTTLGVERKVNAVYHSENEAIVAVQDDVVTPVSLGETSLHCAFMIDGQTIEKDVRVIVSTMTSEEALTLPITALPTDFFDAAKWTLGAENTAKNAVMLQTPNSQSFYMEDLDDGLYRFNMTINNPNSWPSVVFAADGKPYTEGTCYMIGFKSDIIELQRFNNGERTVIFSTIDNFFSIGGPGIPNSGIIEYGKTHDVTFGKIDVENGTRLILNVDGNNVFDFVDAFDGHISGSGKFGVYARAGNFIFTPFQENKEAK